MTEETTTEPGAEQSANTEASEGSVGHAMDMNLSGDAAEAESSESSEEGEGEADSESDGAEVAADGAAKKKRKRKKKKKPAAEGTEKRPQAFTYLFEGAARAHAFRAGEVVAGRVLSVDAGVAVIDLFGKALAYVDVNEPREIEMPQEAGTVVVAPEVLETEAAHDVVVEAEAAPAMEAEAEHSGAHAEEDHHEHEEVEEAPADDDELPELEAPEIGSIFRGRVGAVAESGHLILVNRIIDASKVKSKILAAREGKKRVRGIVYGFNRGGFDVLVDGVRTFCPAGGMSLGPVEDPATLIGHKLEFTLPEAKGTGRSIILSRRGILVRQARNAARDRLKALTVGQRLSGPVTQIRDYGVLVDVGDGLEGLVHQTEVSWVRGQRMADAVRIGETVEVEVLGVQPASRKDRMGRVKLSIKKCLPDPWSVHEEALAPGTVHKGVVTGTTEFGAFVQIAPELQGLLHITELGRGLKHASEVVKEGDEIDVMIERVDRENRKLSLSKLTSAEVEAIAAGEFDPGAAAKSLKQGAHVTVVIDRVEPFGIVGHIKGVVGRRGRAFLPNKELSAEGHERKKAYAQGKEIIAKVIGTDRDGSLKCSVKGLQQDEERRAVREYRKEATQHGFGTFGDLLRSKIDGGNA